MFVQYYNNKNTERNKRKEINTFGIGAVFLLGCKLDEPKRLYI